MGIVTGCWSVGGGFTYYLVMKHFTSLLVFFGSVIPTCIIESVDSINRDERGFPLTQYITNGRISHAG